jgi:broad specificity phosphatase PhoE
VKLILSRHGNTFGPNDPVVWVGAKNDLPLVESGRTQASALASAILEAGTKLEAIVAAPLQRTKEYAEIVRGKVAPALSLETDPRLSEIDYGLWTGLGSAEILSRYGKAGLTEWEQESRWPKDAQWHPSEEEVAQNIHSFCVELQQKSRSENPILVVTSNGVLRYFLKLSPPDWEQRLKSQTFKVRTGNICGMYFKKESVEVNFWDILPTPNVLQSKAP